MSRGLVEATAAEALLELGDSLRGHRPLAAAFAYAAGASSGALRPSLQAWGYFRAAELYLAEGKKKGEEGKAEREEARRCLKKAMTLLRGASGEGGKLMEVLAKLEEAYIVEGDEGNAERARNLGIKNVIAVEGEGRWSWWLYWKWRVVSAALAAGEEGALRLTEAARDECVVKGDWVSGCAFGLMGCQEMLGRDGGQEVWEALERVDEIVTGREGEGEGKNRNDGLVVQCCALCLKCLWLLRRGRAREVHGMLSKIKMIYNQLFAKGNELSKKGRWNWLSSSVIRALLFHIISTTFRGTSGADLRRILKYAHEALVVAGIDPTSCDSLTSEVGFRDSDMSDRQKMSLLYALLESLARISLSTTEMRRAHEIICAANKRIKRHGDDVLPGTLAANELLAGEYYALLGNKVGAVAADAFFTSAMRFSSLDRKSDAGQMAQTQHSLLTGVKRMREGESIVNSECESAGWFAEAICAARNSRVSDANDALKRATTSSKSADSLGANEQVIANGLIMLSNILLSQSGPGVRAENMVKVAMGLAESLKDPITQTRAARQMMKLCSRQRRAGGSAEMEKRYQNAKSHAMEKIMSMTKNLREAPQRLDFEPS